jgi:hypothetical protein
MRCRKKWKRRRREGSELTETRDRRRCRAQRRRWGGEGADDLGQRAEVEDTTTAVAVLLGVERRGAMTSTVVSTARAVVVIAFAREKRVE